MIGQPSFPPGKEFVVRGGLAIARRAVLHSTTKTIPNKDELMPDEIEDEPLNGLGTLAPVKSSLLLFKARGTCAGCEFSAKEGVDRVCRFEPPEVFMFLVPTMVPGTRGPQQGLSPQSFTQFPIVQDGQWCGRYEDRALR